MSNETHMPRGDFNRDPIDWDELPPVERLRKLRDWFADFEPDDVYDEGDC